LLDGLGGRALRRVRLGVVLLLEHCALTLLRLLLELLLAHLFLPLLELLLGLLLKKLLLTVTACLFLQSTPLGLTLHAEFLG